MSKEIVMRTVSRCPQLRRRLGLAIAACLVATATAGSIAVEGTQAGVPVTNYYVTPSTTQAGGHSDLRIFVQVGNRATQNIPAPSCNCQDTRTMMFQMPPGVIGNPHVTPQCTTADFATFLCPVDSQVGVVNVGVAQEKPPASEEGTYLGVSGVIEPVYNLVPHPGEAGLIGFNAPLGNFPVNESLNARTDGDFGLEAKVSNLTHILPLAFTNQRLWGVPASPSHDSQRLPRGCDPFGYEFVLEPGVHCEPGVVSNSPEAPFLNNPTTCGVSLTSSFEVFSYDKEFNYATSPYPATTGCDQLSFNPSLFGQPTTTETDSASGIDIDLQVPQSQSPTTPSPSQLRANTVTLPSGFSINPNAADGKTACTDAEAGFGTRAKAQCPENSKVGTDTVLSSALPGPIHGYLYLGEPLPGNRYRLFLTASGFNTNVKLAGSVLLDPQTGQLKVIFQNLPQTPLSDFNMHFFGSERGLLATPTECGTYPVKSTFVPWDAQLSSQNSEQFFSLGSGPSGEPCPGSRRPFAPTFKAGVVNQVAGAHSRFSLTVGREDGDQNLSGLNVTTPPGFAATLKGIPYCPEAAISALLANSGYSGRTEQTSSTCPAASQIGTTVAGAGAGTHPVYLGGKVFLAGPYKGAPLSLVAVVPAVSGPYDLGNVAVRAAIHVDPVTAQVTAASDPLPQILEGVPLRTRYIQVDLDRPDFALNPTNCAPFSVSASISGSEGAVSSRKTHFQVANCADLPYGPKLELKLRGGVNRRGHPAVRAVLTTKPGEANTHSVSVALPRGEQLDNDHIGTVCTRVAFANEACPAGSLLGTAEASTPLLDRPLKGSVYLRANPEHALPDLVVDLEGQLEIELAGRIDTAKNGGLRTTFETVPDAPVSRFVLNLQGGSKGLLINEASLCGKAKKAIVKMVGQNGARANLKAELQTNCDSKASRHKRTLRTRLLRAGKVG